MAQPRGRPNLLHGTFDTFPLTDLVGMLTAARRTGTIEVRAGGANGHIHLRDGLCVGVEPSAGAPENLVAFEKCFIDACSTFARDPEGSFKFVALMPPPSAFSLDVTSSLVEIERIVYESDVARGLVGSLDRCLEVAPEIQAESITLSAAQWALLANVDGRTPVRDLKRPHEATLLEVCKEIADLVDRGALRLSAEVTVDRVTSLRQTEGTIAEPAMLLGHVPETTSAAHHLAVVAPYGPGVDAPIQKVAEPSSDTHNDVAEVGNVEDEVPTDESTVADRSVMLKMFSALRDA